MLFHGLLTWEERDWDCIFGSCIAVLGSQTPLAHLFLNFFLLLSMFTSKTRTWISFHSQGGETDSSIVRWTVQNRRRVVRGGQKTLNCQVFGMKWFWLGKSLCSDKSGRASFHLKSQCILRTCGGRGSERLIITSKINVALCWMSEIYLWTVQNAFPMYVGERSSGWLVLWTIHA